MAGGDGAKEAGAAKKKKFPANSGWKKVISAERTRRLNEKRGKALELLAKFCERFETANTDFCDIDTRFDGESDPVEILSQKATPSIFTGIIPALPLHFSFTCHHLRLRADLQCHKKAPASQLMKIHQPMVQEARKWRGKDVADEGVFEIQGLTSRKR